MPSSSCRASSTLDQRQFSTGVGTLSSLVLGGFPRGGAWHYSCGHTACFRGRHPRRLP
jgi:hypothetical protein